MNPLVLVFLFLLSTVSYAQKVDISALQKTVEQAGALSGAQALAKSPTFKMAVDLENPTPYQRQQIEQLFASVLKAARGQKFTSQEQMIFYVSRLLPTEGEVTNLLKDAFPAQPDEPAQGKLDCDSRSLFVLGVAEALNYPLGRIYLLQQTHEKWGHVMLFDGKNYYDVTNNTRPTLTQDELIYSAVLRTPAQVKSLLLTNVATAKIPGFSIGGENEASRNQKKEAAKILAQALQLNPQNMTALLNLEYITKNPSYKKQVLEVLVTNYHILQHQQNNLAYITKNPSHKKRVFEVFEPNHQILQHTQNAAVFCAQKRCTPAEQAAQRAQMVDALQNSDTVYDHAFTLLTKMPDDQEVDFQLELADLLLAARPTENIFRINEKAAFAAFGSGEYKAFRKYKNTLEIAHFEDRADRYIREAQQSILNALNPMNTVANIIESSLVITKDNVAALTEKDPFLKKLLEGGPFYIDYHDAVERFRNWTGCKELLDSLGTLQQERKPFCY